MEKSKNRKVTVDVSTSMTEVTGSIYLVNIQFTNGTKINILIDCGKESYSDEVEPFPGFFFNPSNLDAVFITHPHLDHYGRLGELVHEGLNPLCKIYCTKGAEAILPLALTNSYTVDLSKYKKKEMPYDRNDVDEVISILCGEDYNTNIVIEKTTGFKVIVTPLYNAHLPGACSYLVKVSDKNDSTDNIFIFSGDYKEHSALCVEKKIPKEIFKLPVNVFIESTYGARSENDVTMSFMEKVLQSVYQGKKVLIPSISLERFQLILLMLRNTQLSGALSTKIPIFADAPLGVNYSKIMQHDDRIELRPECKNFEPENLTIGSRLSTSIDGPAIFVTGGGMGHGPSQSYISRVLNDPTFVILFTCYQAENSIGRKVIDAEYGEEIIIQGTPCIKKAEVCWTGEFSGHSHQEGLLRFLEKFKHLQSVAITHGDEENRIGLERAIEEKYPDLKVMNFEKTHYFKYQENELKATPLSKLVSVTKTFDEIKAQKEEFARKRKHREKTGTVRPSYSFKNFVDNITPKK